MWRTSCRGLTRRGKNTSERLIFWTLRGSSLWIFWFLHVCPIFKYLKADFIILLWLWLTELLVCSVLHDCTNSWHELYFLILILKVWSKVIIFNSFCISFSSEFSVLLNSHLSWQLLKQHLIPYFKWVHDYILFGKIKSKFQAGLLHRFFCILWLLICMSNPRWLIASQMEPPVSKGSVQGAQGKEHLGMSI